MVDVGDLVAGCPQAALDALLSAADLDAVLDFGPEACGQPAAARLGVWRYQHGRPSSGPNCLWEFMQGQPSFEVVLSAALGGRRVVLERGLLRTRLDYGATLADALRHPIDWVARACRRELDPGRLEPYSASPKVEARMSWRAAAHGWRNHLRDALEDAFWYDRWHVGVREGGLDHLGALAEPAGFRWLPAPAGGYWADPFLDPVGGELLAEEFEYRPSRGRIVRLPLTSAAPARTVIQAAHHLSYPYTFEWDGQAYCLPESAAARQCRLFRLEPSGEAIPDRVLLEGVAVVDPTLFRHEGLWWLFFADKDVDPSLKLFAWYAEGLDGPWRPHRLNPLKCDAGSARPAGKPFTWQGQLHRPAQDCSRTYGGAVVIHAVHCLTPDRFEEHAMLRVEPAADWPYADGIHHLVVEDGRVLIDAKRREFDPLFWLRRRFGAPRRG